MFPKNNKIPIFALYLSVCKITSLRPKGAVRGPFFLYSCFYQEYVNGIQDS